MSLSPRTLDVRPFIAGLGAAALLLFGAASSARAQTSPPPASTPSGGNGIGVGASAFLAGAAVAGAEVDYDTAMWDVDAILGFADRSNGNNNSSTTIQAGVRGWYHLHHGSSSDFSVGGGIGIDHATGGGGPNRTATLIEPGVRARAFVTSNVAVHAVVGISISVGDNLGGNGGEADSGVGLGAQGLFGFGFTYYFK